MSRQPIPFWALALGFAAVFAVALGLTGRERSFLGIAAVVLAGELGLHLFFSAAQSAVPAPAGTAAALWATALLCVPGQHGTALPPGMTVESLLRSVGLDPALAAHAPAASSMSLAMVADAHHGLWSMVAAHVVAGLLSAWWLRRGEAAVFALLRALRTVAMGCLLRLVLLVRPLIGGDAWTPAVPRRRPGDWLLPRAGRCALLLHVVVRRGPPRLALFA